MALRHGELAEDQDIEVGGTILRVLHTPGHSPGSCCLHAAGLHTVFTGDTLFKGGPGATGRSFSDFGTIENSYEIHNFRASVGVGLRVTIPQFGPLPLAFDLAFPVAKALGDPVRLQLVDVLRKHAGKVCVCELVPLFDISQPTLSHHLKKLREAGIVDSERRGLWAYYYVTPEALKELSEWLS